MPLEVRSSSFVQNKTWTLGRSPVSPPIGAEFWKIHTWTPSVAWELWLGICCQAHGLFPSPPLQETVLDSGHFDISWSHCKHRAKAASLLKDDCDGHGQNLRSGGRGVCKCSGGSSLFVCLFVFYFKEDIGALVGSPRLFILNMFRGQPHNLIITDPCVFLSTTVTHHTAMIYISFQTLPNFYCCC